MQMQNISCSLKGRKMNTISTINLKFLVNLVKDKAANSVNFMPLSLILFSCLEGDIKICKHINPLKRV